MNENVLEHPVIILGAGRSGTNMLRDILVQLPGLGTWPCDEINYIWRHGNRDFPTDEFTREMATGPVKAYIRKKFLALARRYDLQTIVEKTCANSLRCAFVHEIFPGARFIHILRDGRDVAVSAAERWHAPLDIGYILRKARYVPPSDLVYYASRYFGNRLHRVLSRGHRLSVWGPKFAGMQSAFSGHALTAACAEQWRVCVERTERDLATVPANQQHTLKYEDFTVRPVETLQNIGRFLNIEISAEVARRLVSDVSGKSVGRWRSKLSSDELQDLQSIAQPLLKRLGYEP